MKSLRLTLHHGPDTVHPMHRFVAERDDFGRYQLVHWNYAHDGRNVFIFHVVGDRDAYRDALSEVEEIVSADVTAGDGDAFYVYVRERPNEVGKQLIEAFSRESLVPIPPLSYRADWSTRFTVVGEPEDLRDAIEAVPDTIETEVERVGEYHGGDPATTALTGRQREALRIARKLGYFDVPRGASVEDVAEALDCAPGTAAEHLRKAEARVMGAIEL